MSEKLREALRRTLEVLEEANDNGIIGDTLWSGPGETLFDLIDAALSEEAPAADAQVSDGYVIDALTWESFLKDYDRYNSGDPRFPFSELRHSLAAVIHEAKKERSRPLPALEAQAGRQDAASALGLTQMILCPQCGNKRCPRATDHRNACTGSNDPGQRGSLYGGCCDYPNCKCPFDAPADPNWCAKGLPQAPKKAPNAALSGGPA